MNEITVLYDGGCRFCRWTIRGLQWQRRCGPMRMIPRQSAEAMVRFPGLASSGVPEDLVVIDAAGGVHRAERAWVVLFDALSWFRWLSWLIARPMALPTAGRMVRLVARHRFRISRLLPRDAVDPQRATGDCGCGEAICASGVEGSRR